MWNLDNRERYARIASFTLPWAWTFADTRPGFTDREKRERIRETASAHFPSPAVAADQWAFRLFVTKAGRTRFDIENVPKLIIDAFCAKQIVDDNSSWGGVGLYPDDTIDHVVLVTIAGKRSISDEATAVEIFAVLQAPGDGDAALAV